MISTVDRLRSGFNSAAPDSGASTAAFPLNHYVIYVDTVIVAARTGPAALAKRDRSDHAFVRGNVSNRIAHRVDIQDVVTLTALLFTDYEPEFDCEGAYDVNDDGETNISDVVFLVRGIFDVSGSAIPPPKGRPGVVEVDGGDIPSELGCAQGESACEPARPTR